MYSGGMFIFKGCLGIIFGLLLIAVPEFTLGAFITLFGLLLIGAGIIAFLFAVTSQQTDTLFWFFIAGGIVLLGILAFFIPTLFAIIFALSIAGWALITAVWDLQKFICSQQRFYVIIGCLAGLSLALIALAMYFIPVLRTNYVATICGFYALVFGLFSLILGEMIVRGRIPKCLMPFRPES
jgi:uncharacterized membrane protein HdeD (DUF308 family)